jgi:hypothetical protein
VTSPAPHDLGLVGVALLYRGLLQIVTETFRMVVAALRDLTGEQSDPWPEGQFNAEHQTQTLDTIIRFLRRAPARSVLRLNRT